MIKFSRSEKSETSGTPTISDIPILDMINSKEWPEAIPGNMICDVNNESMKMERGQSIINFFLGNDIEGNFLDYGCGEGHCCIAATQSGASMSIGYDIFDNPRWSNNKKTILTANLEDVYKYSPFRYILLHDVLDHAIGCSPVDIMNEVKQLSNNDTIIIIRCHPWCSRHGGHLYQDINKAFAHIFLNEFDLKKIGMDTTQRVFFPLSTYKKWFEDAGLKIISEDIEKQEVESFFKNNKILCERMMNPAAEINYSSFPDHQFSQSFVNYIVKI